MGNKSVSHDDSAAKAQPPVNEPVLFATQSTTPATVDIPSWATHVDLIALGGGGGGQGGSLTGVGRGGYGAKWNATTVGIQDWLAGREVQSIHVELRPGPGGASGTGVTFPNGGNPGKPGSQSSVRLYAKTSTGVLEFGHFVGAGGSDPTGNSGSMSSGTILSAMVGQDAQGGNLSGGRDLEFDDVVYVGGIGAGPASPNVNKPGGGGSGGGAGMGAGSAGGIGYCAVRYHAPSPHLKINVYECVGTNSNLELTPFKLGLNAQFFAHTKITGYPNNIFMGQSSAQGIQRVVEAINAKPGRFILVGLSQGALIMGEVYKKLRSGEVNRLSDCLGIVLMGNPIRQEGRAFPGCTPVPSGHGIAAYGRRLTNTTDLVWEFAAEGDPVCANGDGVNDQALTAIFELLMGQTSSLIPLGTAFDAIVQLFTGMSSAHNVYHLDTWKPVQGDSRSGVQIALDHLNKTVGPAHWLDYPIKADPAQVCPDAGETREVNHLPGGVGET